MSAELDKVVKELFLARVAELKEWLRVPSISTLPEYAGEVRKAAEWGAAYLKGMGFPKVEVVTTKRHPLVVAEWCPYPDKPTVLFYGHFDVQPADPLEQWQTPAFEPDERNGNIYARGANDSKGQTMVWLGAMQALLKLHGQLPVNIKVLIEGEEESGGESISAYLPAHAKELRCDAVVVCDTMMFDAENPAICVSTRGIVTLDVVVRGAKVDLHSGLYGGIAPNPLHAIAVVIAKLKGEDGVINIPELNAVTPEGTADEQAFWAKDPVKMQATLEAAMGVGAIGEDCSAYARIGLRPTLEVHGIKGGYVGEGSKTVIPAEATLKMSLRLPPGVEGEPVFDWVQRAIGDALPAGYSFELRAKAAGKGVNVDWEAPVMLQAREAMAEVYGRAPVPIRMGGAIPVLAEFTDVLKVPVVMTGFGLPDDNLHAPNEKFSLDQLQKGMRVVGRLLERLAQGA